MNGTTTSCNCSWCDALAAANVYLFLGYFLQRVEAFMKRTIKVLDSLLQDCITDLRTS